MGKLTENNKKQTVKTLKDLFESKNAYSVDIKLNEEYTMTVYAKSLTDRDLTESVKTFDKELLEDNVNVDVFDSLDLVYHSDYLPLNTLTEKLLSKVCYDLGIKRNVEKLSEGFKKPAKKKAVKKDKVRFVGNPEKEISMFNSFMGESYDADAPELQKLFELLPQLKGLTPDQLNVVAEEILSENEEFECGGDLLSCLADYVIDAFESCKGDCPELSDWVDDIIDSMDVVLVTDDEEGIDSIPELKDLSREKLVELGLELFGNAVAVDDDDVIDALNELIKNHYDDEETINQVIYLAKELEDKEIAPREEGEEELEEGRKRKYIEVRVLQGNYGSGWDDLCEYEIPEDWDEAKKVYKEIRDDVKAYRENEPQYPHRVVSRKKPINNTSKEEKSNTDENKGLKEDATLKIDPSNPKKEIEFGWELVKVDANGKETVLNKGSEEEINNLKSTTKDTPNEKFIVRKSEKVVEESCKGRKKQTKKHLKEYIDEDGDDFVVCCEDVSSALDAGYWHGMTRSERSWGLSVNGSDGDQFSPYFADVITSEISYPVNDGYFEYDGLDIVLTKDTVEDIEDETLKRDLLSVGCSEEDIEEFLNGDDNAEIEFFIDYYIDIDDLEDFEECLKKNLKEDTVKQGSKWVNKGKEGTHGTFKTKKEADAQRKAMFANKKKGSTFGEGMKDRLDAYVKSLDKKEESLEESDGTKIFEVNFEVKNRIPPFEEMNSSQLVKANSEEDAIEKIIKKFGIARDKVNSAREVEIEESLTEAEDEKKDTTTFYSLEVGVLLPEDDEEYNSYNDVFDKKHAFFDESHEESLDEQVLVNKATEYINAGVPGTYGIITKIEVENFDGIEEKIKEVEENGFIEESIDFFNGEQYDIENVVWCAYKNEDEELVNDFLELEEQPAEEVEVKETEVEEESLKEGSILYDIDYAEGPDSYAKKMDKVNSDLKAVKEKYKIETEYDNRNRRFYNFKLNGKDVSIVFYTFNDGLKYDFEYVLVNGEKLDNDKLRKLETSRGGDLGDYYALEPTIKAIQLYIEQEFKEGLKEAAGSMKDKVERSTQNYTKPKGAIQCNKGAQAEEVEALLRQHYKKVEVVPVGKSSVQVKYLKESLEDKTADELAYERYKNGEYTYDEYVTVCKQEECEPLPELKEAKEEPEEDKWTKDFEEFLDFIEFELVKKGKKWSLWDKQGANLGDIESETFEDAGEILDRLDIYIIDYFLDPIAEIIRDNKEPLEGTEDLGTCEDYLNWYNTIGKEKYADELKDSAWDFEVLDMIVNHSDDIVLEKVYHEVEESLKEAYRGKDFDDFMRCLKILGYGSGDLKRIKNENNFNEQELLNYLRKEAEKKGDK